MLGDGRSTIWLLDRLEATLNIKSALLAGAAVLVSTATMAADLPSSKSAPIEYVRVCSAYGEGYFYIPGTQTCLRVGGGVRAEVQTQGVANVWRHRSLGAGTSAGANTFVSKNGQDTLGWEMRGYANLDARTQTAYGTVQTVMILRFVSNSGTNGDNYISNSYTSSNSFSVVLERAYVRFAGFTFGRASSNFTTQPSFMMNTQYRGGYNNGLKQLAYTATFGKNFSATLALEAVDDIGSSGAISSLGTNSVGGENIVAGRGPARLPALVGNLRYSDSWGRLQLSGAVSQTTGNITGPSSLPAAVQQGLFVTNGNGPIIKNTGWAVALGGQFNLPMLGAGDRFDWTVGYTSGLVEMVLGRGLNARTSNNGIWLGGLQRNDYDLTVYDCNPAAGAVTVCREPTKVFTVAGIYTHYWMPSLRSHLASSWTRVTPGVVTRNTDWQQGGLTRATGFALAHNLVWLPVSDFEVNFEVGYARVRQGFAGLNGAAPSNVAVAAACPGGVAPCSPLVANFKANPNNWNTRLRVERTF